MTTPQAKDLPDDIKQQILSQIEQKVGVSNYRTLVEQFGEDGLIDHVLKTAGSEASSKPGGKKINWGSIFYITFGIICFFGLFITGFREIALYFILLYYLIPLLRLLWAKIKESLSIR